MFKVGNKVVEKATGDIGTIIRRTSEADLDVMDSGYEYEPCWYVLWETGSDSGQELWLPEDSLAFYYEAEGTEEKIDLLKRIEDLEAEVENLKKELEISYRFYEVVKKERDYYINLCSKDKPESTRYTGLAGY